MFSKIAIFIASVAVFVAANPVPDIKNSCNTGPVQCCNSVQSADDHGLSNVLGFLGLDLGEVTGQVGVNCNPVTLIGAAGNSWSVFFYFSRRP